MVSGRFVVEAFYFPDINPDGTGPWDELATWTADQTSHPSTNTKAKRAY